MFSWCVENVRTDVRRKYWAREWRKQMAINEPKYGWGCDYPARSAHEPHYIQHRLRSWYATDVFPKEHSESCSHSLCLPGRIDGKVRWVHLQRCEYLSKKSFFNKGTRRICTSRTAVYQPSHTSLRETRIWNESEPLGDRMSIKSISKVYEQQ